MSSKPMRKKSYHSGSVRFYNPHELKEERMLFAFPDVYAYSDLNSHVKRFVATMKGGWKTSDFNELQTLYNRLWRGSSIRDVYAPANGPALRTDKCSISLLSVSEKVSLSELLWEWRNSLIMIGYETENLGTRVFLGILKEVNQNAGYITLDSMGVIRRLKIAKLTKGHILKGLRRSGAGAMRYLLVEVAESDGEREVSWSLLPDDRSETLLTALQLPSELTSSVESTKDEIQPIASPVPAGTDEQPPKEFHQWVSLLESKVLLRIGSEGDSENIHGFVLDRVSWDPETQMMTVASKGQSFTKPASLMRLEPLSGASERLDVRV